MLTPSPVVREVGQLYKASWKGGQRRDIMFPFHRNPELLKEVSNITDKGLSFLTATP